MIPVALSPALSYKLNSLPRGEQHGAPIAHTCNVPYRALTIDLNGDCFLCMCDGWLPIPVGKIEQFDTLNDVWNCDTANILQKDVADKKFTWCAVQNCNIVDHNIKLGHYQINVNIDESCNLACPSCRATPIMHTSGDAYDRKLSQVNKLVSMLEQFNYPTMITLTGNGDPLASSIIRPLILNYRPKSNHSIRLHTNGLLIKKLLPQSSILPRITNYSISVDAGSAEVYADVRRPGKWEILIDNLDCVKSIAQKNGAQVTLSFCYQRANFIDLPNFIDLCERYNFNGEVVGLVDWGTWSNFEEQNVLDPAHQLYIKSNEVLQGCITRNRNLITFSQQFNHIRKSNISG